MDRDELRERLGELVHDMWIEWWEEHLSWNCEKPEYPDFVILPPATVARWERTMEAQFDDLYSTEHQLEMADKVLDIVEYYLELNDGIYN